MSTGQHAVSATDTMKNTVYAWPGPSDRACRIVRAALGNICRQAVRQAPRISIAEQRWDRLAANASPSAFVQAGDEHWTTVVTREADASRVVSGLAHLVVLKTAESAFSGFPRDAFTTLPDTDDRLLATSITASWTYREGTTEFGVRDRIRAALLETFAAHRSRSVQHTLYAMGEAALAAAADATEITLTLPNRHHLLVDLAPFGPTTERDFVATDQPYGVIEAMIKRAGSRLRATVRS
jgi:urate oxidase